MYFIEKKGLYLRVRLANIFFEEGLTFLKKWSILSLVLGDEFFWVTEKLSSFRPRAEMCGDGFLKGIVFCVGSCIYLLYI